MNESSINIQSAGTVAIPIKKYPYYIENPVIENRVERFLEAFATVLQYSDYKSLLDSYCNSNTKCNRCAVACPVFLVTGDPRDIPCYRTNLLFSSSRNDHHSSFSYRC